MKHVEPLSKYRLYATSQEAWEAMKEAVREATQSIYWEMYILVDDQAGREFFDLFEQKAKEGLDVKLIIDYLGSFEVSRKRINSLKEAGVDVRLFSERKKRYRGWWKMMISRTHRKIVVIDEKIGFIGGVNVQEHMKDWLDFQVRIEGKVVRSLLRAFAKMYIICGGEKSEVKHLFQYNFTNDHEVNFVYDEAHSYKSTARKKYVEALKKARERVILFSPYYFPDKEFLQAMWQARKRGVRVDLLIPFRSDLRLATYAAYALFSLMKTYGVQVHLIKKMMHGKGVIVDDDWAMIGSSNIDQSSFNDTYEANVKIKNKEFVKRLKDTLSRWIDGESVKLDDLEWEKRSWTQRIKETLALWFYQIWHRKGGKK